MSDIVCEHNNPRCMSCMFHGYEIKRCKTCYETIKVVCSECLIKIGTKFYDYGCCKYIRYHVPYCEICFKPRLPLILDMLLKKTNMTLVQAMKEATDESRK